ncbi:MAG: MGDG synthase family glycosyltransferase, partial [Anaerolineae bacterium]
MLSHTGGGHRASAGAVRDELHRLHGDAVQVELLDLFTALDLWPFDRLPAWWPAMIGMRGLPWALLYRLTNGAKRMKVLSRLAWPYVGATCQRILRQHPADVVVSFHPVPNYTLQRVYAQEPTKPSLATIVLDLVSVHAAWFVPGYDLYVVPTAGAAARACQWGVPSERLQVVGMPTRRSFVERMDLPRETARRHLGLDDEKPLVLFVGGGEGMGPIEAVIKAVGAARPPAQLAVITGRNDTLRRRLIRLDLPLRVEGFVTEMELWFRAADLLVTKAGPNTLAEAFITG